tara:strand:- start:572 stop:754 length:183 start_codon:yes stop_codon:yes gene_type:complete
LEGDLIVTPESGEPVRFGAGDRVFLWLGFAAFGMFVGRFESITALVETSITSANVITGFS